MTGLVVFAVGEGLLTGAENLKKLASALLTAGILFVLFKYIITDRTREAWGALPVFIVGLILATAAGISLFRTLGIDVVGFVTGAG
jgi:hypothetical protein